MHKRKRLLLSAAMVGTSTAITFCPYAGMTAFATQAEITEIIPDEITETFAIQDDTESQSEGTEDFSSLSEDELAAEYQQYLRELEEKENNPDTLTAEEEAEGYEIVDGVKKAPDELEGDLGEEISFGGVIPGTNTGYVNFFTEMPEYVHENAYVIVMNLNTGAMFGCRTYEVNGFQAQICLPAGIYMISEGGLSSDTTGRFYMLSQQFQVKSGSQQTIVAQIADSHPELAEAAYPEDETSEAEENETIAEITSANGTTEKQGKKSDAEGSEAEDTDGTKKKTGSAWQTVVLTVLFTVIPLGFFAAMYMVTRKPKRGFDE